MQPEGPATAQAKGDRSLVLSSYPILLMQLPRLDSSSKLDPCLLTTELSSPITYLSSSENLIGPPSPATVYQH